jgi:5-enolpyruvylshikimate-3-phosphate synthase
MSLAVLLTVTGGEIIGAEAIKKSYPAFFRDLSMLGIQLLEREDK